MNAKVNPTNPWTLPTATLVLPADAAREQWLEARRKGIGGSDIPLLMGVSEYGSEYELWLSKTGRSEDTAPTGAMQRGHWLEAPVVDYFAHEMKLAVRRCGLLAHKEYPIYRATPDRLVGDGGLLEVKTVQPHAKVAQEWRHGGIARHAYVQAQWQLLVSGRTHVWFCAYIIDSEHPDIRGPVERDEPLIDRMARRAHVWWDSYVVPDQAPPVDLQTITDEEIALRWPKEEPGSSVETEYPSYLRHMLAERAECKTAEKAAKERSDEIDRALRVMAGPVEALCIGERPVVTFKSQRNNPSINPALETDFPELWERYVRVTSSRRIRVRKGWDG